MGEVKEINFENRTYYFYNDMINVKNFDPNLLKINRKSYKNIGICNIGYITIYPIYPIYTILKKLMIVKVFTVRILCICLLIMQVDISNKRMEINT